jgi:hypothetical protein
MAVADQAETAAAAVVQAMAVEAEMGAAAAAPEMVSRGPVPVAAAVPSRAEETGEARADMAAVPDITRATRRK